MASAAARCRCQVAERTWPAKGNANHATRGATLILDARAQVAPTESTGIAKDAPAAAEAVP